MRKSEKIFWGVILILTALLILASVILKSAGIQTDIPYIKIIAAAVMLALSVEIIINRHYPLVFFPLALILIIFKSELATYVFNSENKDIFSNWIIILCAVMLYIGTSILLPRSAKRSKPGTKSIGDAVKYIDCTDFTEETLNNRIGSITVFFENTQNYVSGGTLHLTNNIGDIVVTVDDDWKLNVKASNRIGDITYPSSDGLPDDAKVLNIDIDNKIGDIIIKRKNK